MDRTISDLYAANRPGTLYALLTGTHNLLMAAAKENHIPLQNQLALLSQFNNTFKGYHNARVTGFVYQRSNVVDTYVTQHLVVASAIWIAEEAIEAMNNLGQTDATARFTLLVRNALERIAAAWSAFANQFIYGGITYQVALESAARSLRRINQERYNSLLSILKV